MDPTPVATATQPAAAAPDGPGQPPTTMPAPAGPPPPAGRGARWPVFVVLATMALAVGLFLAGFTTGAVLGLLAGAAYLGLDIVDRLERRGGA